MSGLELQLVPVQASALVRAYYALPDDEDLVHEVRGRYVSLGLHGSFFDIHEGRYKGAIVKAEDVFLARELAEARAIASLPAKAEVADG